ncbi:hypothetical protein GQ54DRAFT_309359, partial [Martensiomyces pterosporus]
MPMLHMHLPSHYGTAALSSKWLQAKVSSAVTGRALTTKCKDSSSPMAATKQKPQMQAGTGLSGIAANPRRLVTSARILPDGFVRPALYDEHTPIPRCESCPTTYHAGLFPWLLSAERQRIPYDDLELQRAAACTNAALAPVPSLSSHPRGVDGVFLENAAGCLPSPVRRYLAHLLNMHIATRALGPQAVQDITTGAAHALPRVVQLLSAASGGNSSAGCDLARLLTSPLL